MRLQPPPSNYTEQFFADIERRLAALEARPTGAIKWYEYRADVSYNGQLLSIADQESIDTIVWTVYADLGSAVHVCGLFRSPATAFGGAPLDIGSGVGVYRFGFPTRWHPTFRRLTDYQIGWASLRTQVPAVCYYRPGEKVGAGSDADALTVSWTNGIDGVTGDAGQWDPDTTTDNQPVFTIQFGGTFEAYRDDPQWATE